MRNSMLLPAALLGLAGCVPVQVPAGSQVTGMYVSPAQPGSLSPTVTTTYQTPVPYVAPAPSVTYVMPPQTTTTYVAPVPTTTTYVTSVPTTTQYVMPEISASTSESGH
jgi:hypothetical protein